MPVIQHVNPLSSGKETISAEALRLFIIQSLRCVGVPNDQAEIVADSLVFADLRGVSSHGIVRLPIYIRRLQRGLISATSRPETACESGCISLLDGKNGLGQVNALAAIKKAIAIAGRAGIGACGVRHSNHCGALAYFSMMALKQDMIGIAMTNANPVMAPWGGMTARLGSNPISMAAPAGNALPLVVDMATSTVAKGRVILATKERRTVPLDWGINRAGEPTSDPEEILEGALLPVAGPKGYALALIIDVLSGVLTGSLFGSSVRDMYEDFGSPQGIGHFMLAIDISRFMDLMIWKARMDDMISSLKLSQPAEGFAAILLPGEPEYMVYKERRQRGIPLDAALSGAIQDVTTLLDSDCIS